MESVSIVIHGELSNGFSPHRINQDSLNQYNSRPFPDYGQRTPRNPFDILTYADRLNLPVPIALNAIPAQTPQPQYASKSSVVLVCPR